MASETNFVGTDQFLTAEQISQLSIGAGDEVFMIGRFLNMQGDGIIKPVVRFGSISMETTEFVHNKAMGQDEESFIVEMRSRTGFSGSPVMMYRTDATSISTFHPTNFIYGLLGINWGYIYNEDKENSFMNGVVPAWKILELLEHPTLLKKHAEAEARIKFALSDLGQRIMSAFPGPSI
ncbi:hypothetical protein CTI14_02415 [Methylobacterium radiotolerans]|nr:hypothetical protein CTI14_02415 [Methylobacterium radiotolerans]